MGTTHVDKDSILAPSGSLSCRVLLDTGSLAGDFISGDLLARLDGKDYVYQTPTPLLVRSGLDSSVYSSSDMIDIAIHFLTSKGLPKTIRLSVRISPSSSIDLIIGLKSFKRHNFFRFFYDRFTNEDILLPSSDIPSESLPTLVSTVLTLPVLPLLTGALPRPLISLVPRFVPATIPAVSAESPLPLAPTIPLLLPLPLLPGALPRPLIGLVPRFVAATTSDSSPTQFPLSVSAHTRFLQTYGPKPGDTNQAVTTPHISPVVSPLSTTIAPLAVPPTLHMALSPSPVLPTLLTAQHLSTVPPITLPIVPTDVVHAVTTSTLAIPLDPCSSTLSITQSASAQLIPGHYAQSGSDAPDTLETGSPRQKKRKLRSVPVSADGTSSLSALAALLDDETSSDMTEIIPLPRGVILAMDYIDNDKVDTFGPYVDTPPRPVLPSLAFLDEISFGGSPDLQAQLRTVCTEFADIFSDDLPDLPADLPPFKIEVNKLLWECPGNRTPVRPQSTLKMTHIQKHIDSMLKSGIIEKTETPYYSHPVIIQKTADTFRFCVDYRGLNNATEQASWPIPNITQLFDRISAHQPNIFGVMDLTSGYHQAPLHLDARKYTAFHCFAGLYQFTRLPFGPKRAPSYFQEQMVSSVLVGLIYTICEVYLDDILIYGKGPAEFIARTRQVFERFRLRRIRLKAKKTKLGHDKIEYVGREISAKGLSMSTSKIHAFLDIPRPLDVTSLRKFLGVGNYFRGFIQNHSNVVSPLFQMLKGLQKKRAALTWSPKGIEAFENLRTLISNCPLLHFPNDKSGIILRTDASDYGIGGVLFQTILDVDYPIAFVSKSLTDIQLRWSVIQKEAFAIFYCCTTLDYLLRDRKFVIETDHRNLTYLQKNNNSMVIRWNIAIQELDYTVRFIPGSQNTIADSMSRLCPNFAIEPDSQMLAALTDYDSMDKDHIESLSQCHNSIIGHGGVDRTIANLQQLSLDWPTMKQDVKLYIQTCPVCQKLNTSKTTSRAYPFSTSSSKPMSILNIDFVGPFPTKEYILVIIDTHSRWIELFQCPDASSESAAHALLAHFGRYGCPQQIRSDRGSHFVNATIQHFLRFVKVPHQLTLAYSKEENGIVERANKEINRHLRALCFDASSTSNLQLMIPFVQRIINSTSNSITSIKPAQIMFGNVINLDESILSPPTPGPDNVDIPSAVQEMIQIQDALIQRSTSIRQTSDERRLATHDLPTADFAPGTLVLIQYATQPPTRLHTKWFGPLRVISNVLSEYTLLDLVTKKEKHIHVTRIKQFLFSTTSDPLDIARRDYLEYFVEEILSHRGNIKKVSTLQFYVKWLGYSSAENSWESWANLRLVAPLHDYLRSRQLSKLIPKASTKASV